MLLLCLSVFYPNNKSNLFLFFFFSEFLLPFDPSFSVIKLLSIINQKMEEAKEGK